MQRRVVGIHVRRHQQSRQRRRRPLGQRQPGVGVDRRRLVVNRRHRDREDLTGEIVGAVADREGEAVARGLAVVMHIDHLARIQLRLGETGDRRARRAGQLQLAVRRRRRHRVLQRRVGGIHVGRHQQSRQRRARALVQRQPGVGEDRRRLVVNRRHRDGEDLTGETVHTVADREGEAVAGGLAAVMHIDHRARIQLRLGETGDRRARRAGQLQLAVRRRRRHRVLQRRVGGIHVGRHQQSRQRRARALVQRQPGVGEDRRRRVEPKEVIGVERGFGDPGEGDGAATDRYDGVAAEIIIDATQKGGEIADREIAEVDHVVALRPGRKVGNLDVAEAGREDECVIPRCA